jgi:hypothetical protein
MRSNLMKLCKEFSIDAEDFSKGKGLWPVLVDPEAPEELAEHRADVVL